MITLGYLLAFLAATYALLPIVLLWPALMVSGRQSRQEEKHRLLWGCVQRIKLNQ